MKMVLLAHSLARFFFSRIVSIFCLTMAIVIILLWARSFELSAYSPWIISSGENPLWIHLYRGHLNTNVLSDPEDPVVGVSLIHLVVLLLAPPAIWCMIQVLRPIARRYHGCCYLCGYPLHGPNQPARCPECGTYHDDLQSGHSTTWSFAIRRHVHYLFRNKILPLLTWTLPKHWGAPKTMIVLLAIGIVGNAVFSIISLYSTTMLSEIAYNARPTPINRQELITAGLGHRSGDGHWYQSVSIGDAPTDFTRSVVLSTGLLSIAGALPTALCMCFSYRSRQSPRREFLHRWTLNALLSGCVILLAIILYGATRIMLVDRGIAMSHSELSLSYDNVFIVYLLAIAACYCGIPPVIALIRSRTQANSDQHWTTRQLGNNIIVGIG